MDCRGRDCMIYTYLCNKCLSSLKLWVRIPLMAEVYSIQHYVIKFVCDLSVGFTEYSDFLNL
jgi:hypothetical protein